MGVFVAYASRFGQTLIDRRLYLPEAWARDQARRKAASIPQDVAFATKPAMARAMLADALDRGVPCAWVLADAAYGGVYQMRRMLEERRQPYVLAVRSNHTLRMDEEVDEDDKEDEDDLENAAVERLMANIGDYPNQEDQIEKFCLPILRSAASDSAVEHVLENLKEKPHQTRLYFSYISTFVRSNPEVVGALEELVADATVSGYQRMFLLAALLRARTVERATVNAAIQWLQNPRVAKETRAMAAIFAAKHGVAVQKRAVRTSYEGEQSDYVRSAILFASKYLSVAERRTCKRAWGGHSAINTLIAKAI